ATVEGGGPARHLVSLHGTAGHQVRRLQEFTYPWGDDDVLVMHSDGVNAHWALDAYPGLRLRDPLTIAAVLLRDYSRGRDDATVVVAKRFNDER
ncbi:MAG: serine/threonine protein kinase, partial [Acidobacteriota bacterium]